MKEFLNTVGLTTRPLAEVLPGRTLTINEFQVAMPRTFIPVEGLWPGLQSDVGPKYDLSAGLQGYIFPFQQEINYALSNGRDLAEALYASKEVVPGQTLLAIADNNDDLYEKVLSPAINEFLKGKGASQILIPQIGYPIISWFAEGLDGTIVEANFFELISSKASLPPEIGCVYIDCPGTFWGSLYEPTKVFAWMNENPEVLFLVDQANLGYFQDSQQGKLADLRCALPENNHNVVVTNTTTKAFVGTRVAAWAWSSKDFAHAYAQDTYLTYLPDPEKVALASNLFQRENLTKAQELRATIVAHREQLAELLEVKYGVGSVLHKAQSVNHSLILNATMFGFDFGTEMALAFASGIKPGAKPFGLKPTDYYGDATKTPILEECVYIAIPLDGKVFNDLLYAFDVGG